MAAAAAEEEEEEEVRAWIQPSGLGSLSVCRMQVLTTAPRVRQPSSLGSL